MRLKRLELQGFKSFLDRTILTFEPGITGVVGPNGCGKSNIVDAIQWVMGEQSAKHLRGEAMTDVIFNGSDHKAATSMAEVSLILDRNGVALSPQFAAFDKGEEIAVTRRVYRDGTGEFLINKTPCRLKDIHELFMDTGVGRRAYSIIEQGQIDRMINVKPEERRFLFEEVAGITKYKVKRKEAEKKLELTGQNLVRLHDIVNELEKQIRSLKVQATRARKYKELKGELEAVDLFLLGRSLYNHKKAIQELSERREELALVRSESDALFGQMDAQITELEVLRIDQEKIYQSLGEREHDLSLLIQKLESQLTLFEERRKNISQNCENGVKEEGAIQQETSELHEEGQRVDDELESLADNFQALEKAD
jgi:chromosome segregation protein